MGVAIDRARPALDFDQQEACGCQDEQIDLVDAPLVVHELEVRPCPPRVVVRQMLAEELKSLAFPLVCRGANNCPTRWLHGLPVLMRPSSPSGVNRETSVVNEMVLVIALPRDGAP